MKVIIVDDDKNMIECFLRHSKDIEEVNVLETFTSPQKALEFANNNDIDVAFLDIEMPTMSGLELANRLREIRKDIIIIFVTAHDMYIRESNKMGADDYLVKPYDKEILLMSVERIKLISVRQRKKAYMHMFGTFNLTYEGEVVRLVGKVKEILAYIAVHRGNEVSNQEIYTTVWDKWHFNNKDMTAYFHALKRLKNALEKKGLEDLIISNARGQMINTKIVDCDYYSWLDNDLRKEEKFRGEFLTEYSWGEEILADMLEI